MEIGKGPKWLRTKIKCSLRCETGGTKHLHSYDHPLGSLVDNDNLLIGFPAFMKRNDFGQTKKKIQNNRKSLEKAQKRNKSLN